MLNPEKLKKLKEVLPTLRTNEPTSAHTSIGVGGKTLYFDAENIDELRRAVETTQELMIPYRVIGAGSNIIFSDWDWDGLIIKNTSKNLVIDKTKNQIIADAGVSLSQLIMFAASNGLSGLEPLIGIPGTVGGAVYGNAGSHSKDIGSFVKSITLLGSGDKVETVDGEAMGFDYRTSILKRENKPPQTVILSVTFQLFGRRQDDIAGDIAKYQKWRHQHQPLGEKTTGSVFKNPSGTSAGDRVQSAGYLLESVGAKDWQAGNAATSKDHANWIINKGSAKAVDIRHLISAMRQAVSERFDINLTEEVEFLGDWTNVSSA